MFITSAHGEGLGLEDMPSVISKENLTSQSIIKNFQERIDIVTNHCLIMEKNGDYKIKNVEYVYEVYDQEGQNAREVRINCADEVRSLGVDLEYLAALVEEIRLPEK